MAKLVTLGPLLLAGLLALSLTAAAESEPLEWTEVSLPAEGRGGGWVLSPGTDIGQLSLAADGSLYAAVIEGGDCRLMVSEDGGSRWEETAYRGESITAIVCCPDGETIYLSDDRCVYKSGDGGQSFSGLGEGTLPAFDENEAISCLDVFRNGSNQGVVFIGTADSDSGEYGGVYYLNEGDFGAEWTDMGAGGYDIYSLAASPSFGQDYRLIALASDESRSYIINNDGIIGGWSPGIELLKDGSGLAVSAASRICFPEDFESFQEFYIGVGGGADGGVYRINEDEARELGPEAAIVSLALAEDGGPTLLAGGGGGGIWLSRDGGNSWETVLKPPTGEGRTGVALAPGFAASGLAYAATSGPESAFSLSIDGGLTWNQLGLIDTEISDIVGLAPSPEYSRDGTLFMLSYHTGGDHSLWRSQDEGGNWERVYCGALPGVDSLEEVALSPEYGDENRTVLLAGTGEGNPSIWRSADNGQSFSRRNTPLPPDVWALVDDSRWFIGGYDGEHGLVYYTANGGQSYSEGVTAGESQLCSLALSPEYATDGTILAGNEDGGVYWSEDGGQSFEALGEPLPELIAESDSTSPTVAFDPGYGTNCTVYAASHCREGSNNSSAIYRLTTDDNDDWEAIDSLDEGAINEIIVSAEGTLYAANAAAGGGIERCLDPTFPLQPTFESVGQGLDEDAKLVGLWLHEHRLWSIDTENNKPVTYFDSLTSPVTLTSPGDEVPGVGIVVDDTVRAIELDWETLPGATEYQWQLNYEEDFSSLPEGFDDTSRASSAHLPALEPMTTYYWKVRAVEPVLSPWSEKRSFTTTMGSQASAPGLESPAAGAREVPVDPIFQWSAIAGADSYELMVSTIITFDNPTILKTGEYALPATAWHCNIILNYDTTYYWKVRAASADSHSAWSAVSAFTTEAEPVGTIAEAYQPQDPDNAESSWLEGMSLNGVIMLVMALVMLAVLVTLIILVIKVSKL